MLILDFIVLLKDNINSMELMRLTKKFSRLILALFCVFAAGVLGYMIIEGWNFLDSIYMTVITLATVGYGETQPLHSSGRIFTIFLILGGMTVVSYGVLTLTSLIAEGELQRLLRRGKMDKEISKLKDHFIVCGVGELGRHIVEELKNTKRQFVIIDRDAEKVKRLAGEDVLYIEGDATQDATLQQAGVERAGGVYCCLKDDKENLFAVLTARELNPKTRIITKCIEDESEQKFYRAGADKTISTIRIGGLRMASEMMRPTVASFLDLMLRDKKNIRFEEVLIRADSKVAGKTLAETGLHDKTGAMVVAMKDCKGEYIYNPKGSTLVPAESVLIVLGDVDQVRALSEFVRK
ncbi:MAG: potassium channel protein [Candidatus Firestonebacteria bacterium]